VPSDPGDGGTPPGDGGTPPGDGGTPGGGDAPGSGDIEGGFAPTIDLASLPASVTVSRTGVFHLTFRGTPGRAGTLTLRTEKAVAAARRRRLVLARLSFTMPASGRARLRVRLDRRGLRVLRRVRRLPVSAKLTLGPTAARRRLVLRAPRR
jgi:hypothetical protein